MGKGSSGGSPNTSVVQPQLPNLPNQAQINSQAQNRLYASQPWMNSPWRPIDFFPQQAPTQYLPQFTPPGAASAVGGGQDGGQGGASASGAPTGNTQTYAPQQPQGPAGIPGFGPPGFGLGGVQMPNTQIGQQAIAQQASPGLMGMLQFLGGAMMPQGGLPQQQGPPPGQGPQPAPPKQVA